jgi:hypothetical protein
LAAYESGRRLMQKWLICMDIFNKYLKQEGKIIEWNGTYEREAVEEGGLENQDCKN